MTNEQFEKWAKLNFKSNLAAANGLGLDRDTVQSLKSGKSRGGAAYPVPVHISLACAAWTLGLREYTGGPVQIG